MTTGNISTYESGVDFVVLWRISHFYTFKSDGAYYYSPGFDFGGEGWQLGIFPNGSSTRGTSGFVDLRLAKSAFGQFVRLSFSLSLKTAEGEKYNEHHVTRDFGDDGNWRQEFIRFISRSRLNSRRSELLPDDVLTVICTMKESKSAGSDSEACASGSSVCPHDEELHQDFKQLFLSKEDCDVIIRVQGSEFPAHRAILKARSPVFASTFRHDMKENATGIVDIEDCDSSTFSDFLCFLYCGDATLISRENVFGLFTGADKYQVLNLRAKCLEFMKRNLSVDTFCETLTLALRHSEAELVKLCTNYFKQNVPRIIVTVKWQTFLAKNPTESNEFLIKSFVPNSS